MSKKSKPDTKEQTRQEKVTVPAKRANKKTRIFSISEDATLHSTITQVLHNHLRLETNNGNAPTKAQAKSHHAMLSEIGREILQVVINVDKDLAVARTELLMETMSNHLDAVPARELATTMGNIRIM